MRISHFLALLLLLMGFPGKAQVHAMDTMQFIGSGFKAPSHPRILLGAGEEDLLRRHIGSDPAWQRIHHFILRQADSLLHLPPATRTMIGIRLLATSRDCLFRIFHLSYAWRMTGEQKYFRRAERELLAVAGFSDWNPSHYLDVAEMTTGAAIGYDWLYKGLSTRSRVLIREAILKKGIATSYDSAYPSYRKWLSVTNNWNQVCNTGMLLGALAVYEDDPVLSRKVINRSIASIGIAMKDYDPEGAFAEGYTYWGYGTTFNVLFLSVLEKTFGTNFGLGRQGGWLKTAGYLENMVGPTGLSFNYSDAMEASILQPAMFWFAKKLDDLSLLWNQRTFLAEGEPMARLSDRLLPAILVWSEGIDLAKVSPPTERIWAGGGRNPVALMRSSWTDPAAIFIGFKGGSPSVTHGHMDAGSFVMDANGERWAMDPGMQDYNLLEQRKVDLWANQQDGQRWEIFRYHNRAHNTLLVNGHSQRVDGFAEVRGGTEKGGRDLHAIADLSSLYKGDLARAEREVTLRDGKYVLVSDEITTGDSGALVRWSMLTTAKVTITGPHTALLRKGGKSLSFFVEGGYGLVVRCFSADPPPQDYDEPNPGVNIVGFDISLPPGTRRSFHVFLTPGDVPVLK